jgi:hypothetical protein
LNFDLPAVRLADDDEVAGEADDAEVDLGEESGESRPKGAIGLAAPVAV